MKCRIFSSSQSTHVQTGHFLSRVYSFFLLFHFIVNLVNIRIHIDYVCVFDAFFLLSLLFLFAVLLYLYTVLDYI